MNLKKYWYPALLAVVLGSCKSPPSQISEMTFEEYIKSLGRRSSPYIQEDFKDYEAWTNAGGHKEDKPRRPQGSGSVNFGQIMTAVAAASQLAGVIKGTRQPSYPSTAVLQSATQPHFNTDGPWYPCKFHYQPGVKPFEINGRFYDAVILKPGDGSMARPAP